MDYSKMMNSKILEEKDKIRKSIRSKLKLLNEDDLNKKSQKIYEKLFLNEEFSKASCILFFVPLKTEPNITPVLEKCLSLGKKCFVPRVINEEKMEFFLLKNDFPLSEQLEKGSFNILEPKSFLEKIEIESLSKEIDVILVPALAFSKTKDNNFSRLGKGKGYYDRFFEEITNFSTSFSTIGIAFDFQLLKNLPTEKTDFAIQNVITD